MKKTPSKKKLQISKVSPLVYSGDDLLRHIGAFSENIRGDVAGIAEQVVGLYEKIDEVDGRLSKKIDDVKTVVDTHTLILNEHSVTLKQHSTILDKHSTILDKHSTILDKHSTILDKHSTILDSYSVILRGHSEMIGRILLDLADVKSGMREKIDRKEFVALEKRMVALEAHVLGGKTKEKTK